MNKVVLYTKSYSGDLDRLKELINSVKIHNKDNIPYYISVPSHELSIFKQQIDTDYVNLVADDHICDVANQDWKAQQVVKSTFWKLGVCDNYVLLDSDAYFINDFYIKDFLYDDHTPYTVMHEQKDLFEWTARNYIRLGFDPFSSFLDTRKSIMDVLGRVGRIYDFGPVPVIWNTKVWKSLEENYLLPNKLQFSDLINVVPSELTWYGEYLLVSKEIPIVPIEPMFKVFHFAQQYADFKQQGYQEEHFKQNYLGIIMQSNWGAPLKY